MMSVADECETKDGVTEYQIYRFNLDGLQRFIDEEDGETHLCFRAYNPSWPYHVSKYKEWFQESLGDIARCHGVSTKELVEMLCSEDPRTLAQAYEMIGGYHGYINLDQYPDSTYVTEGHDCNFWPNV